MNAASSSRADLSVCSFHVFRNCDGESYGPYHPDHLVRLLNSRFLERDDWVYFDGLESWKPLHEVFEIEERVINRQDDGQEQAIFNQVFLAMTQLALADEEVYYIAHQAKVGRRAWWRRPSRLAVAVTSEALWWGDLRETGYFDASCLYWADVTSLQHGFPRHWDWGVLEIGTSYRGKVVLKGLPRRQLRGLVRCANEVLPRLG